jgi:Arc/MetJ family transcription regulator
MRTTITLDEDVYAAVQRLRKDRDLGLSEAVNELARAGMGAPVERPLFRQRSMDLGLLVDVSNVQEALDIGEGPGRRW